jgi:hypothetical protein
LVKSFFSSTKIDYSVPKTSAGTSKQSINICNRSIDTFWLSWIYHDYLLPGARAAIAASLRASDAVICALVNVCGAGGV